MKEQYSALLPKFVELVKANEVDSCVHYGFVGPTEDGLVICREGYSSAEGLIKHLDNVGDVLNEALQYADIVDLMCQGPAEELEKLKEPLKDFGATFYPMAAGAVRSNRKTSTWDDDRTITLVPKFKIKEGMKEQYSALLPKFVELVKANEVDSCVHYGFVGPTEDGLVICREGYSSAEGLIKHLDNVGDVLNEALQYADIVDLMCQGPAEELEKMKEPLKDFGATFYPLAAGAVRTEKN